MSGMSNPQRLPLPDVREGITYAFVLLADQQEHKFYLTFGTYPDGRLGEMFIEVGKLGSLIHAALDRFAMAMSIGLQYGVPVQQYTRHLHGVKAEPFGTVLNPPPAIMRRSGLLGKHLRNVSAYDYIARYIDWKFPAGMLRMPPKMKGQ